MASQPGPSIGVKTRSWIGPALCVAVASGWLVQRFAADPNGGKALAPDGLPLVAAACAAVAMVPVSAAARWLRLRNAFRWAALLLMVWVANGLLFDLLAAAGLMGHKTASGEIVLSTVYWPGLATRAAAFAVVVLLAPQALATTDAPASARAGWWYGYAAFALALPYPVLRLHWAMGGTVGLGWQGAAGEGWEPLLIAIPWVMAAVLSLLLVSPPRWMPRRLLLTAGWSATCIVATIGPAAVWAFVSTLISGGETDNSGIAIWVFGLFYTSWFLWAIAGGAATRSYQLRSGAPAGSSVPAHAG